MGREAQRASRESLAPSTQEMARLTDVSPNASKEHAPFRTEVEGFGGLLHLGNTPFEDQARFWDKW